MSFGSPALANDKNIVAKVVSVPPDHMGSSVGADTMTHKCALACVGTVGGSVDVVGASAGSNESHGVYSLTSESRVTGVGTGVDALPVSSGGIRCACGAGDSTKVSLFRLDRWPAAVTFSAGALMLEVPVWHDMTGSFAYFDREV